MLSPLLHVAPPWKRGSGLICVLALQPEGQPVSDCNRQTRLDDEQGSVNTVLGGEGGGGKGGGEGGGGEGGGAST